jgi:hypothetical protein
MKVPMNFQFSQTNLQDFVDCRRRFFLKHILHLAWPAIVSEPVLESERLSKLGSRFHHLAHQYLLGIPIEGTHIPYQDQEIIDWLDRFKRAIAQDGNLHSAWQLSTFRYPEITLIGHLGEIPLIAMMDLIAIEPGNRVQIFDWKTSQNVPRRDWLVERLQTKVYSYLMVKAGGFLNNGRAVSPDQIIMSYWYPTEPDVLIHIPYSQRQYQADEEYLNSLVESFLQLMEDEFSLTLSEARCKFCTYRSLCDRGITAGQLTDFEASLGITDEIIHDLELNTTLEIM